MSAKQPPITPDARYILIRGRLWRATNPTLAKAKREKFVKALMVSRRAIRDAKTGSAAMASARRAVEHAKRGLGERGPVWWRDDARDYNRFLARNTPYAEWAAALA